MSVLAAHIGILIKHLVGGVAVLVEVEEGERNAIVSDGGCAVDVEFSTRHQCRFAFHHTEESLVGSVGYAHTGGQCAVVDALHHGIIGRSTPFNLSLASFGFSHGHLASGFLVVEQGDFAQIYVAVNGKALLAVEQFVLHNLHGIVAVFKHVAERE